jgi:hypothetical protein
MVRDFAERVNDHGVSINIIRRGKGLRKWKKNIYHGGTEKNEPRMNAKGRE